MNIKIFEENFNDFSNEWDVLLNTYENKNIFFTPIWHKLWWNSFSCKSELKLLSLKNDDKLIRIGRLEQGEITDLTDAPIPQEMSLLLTFLDQHRKVVETFEGNSSQLQDVTLVQPIVRPPKILAIGLNYKDHIKETGFDTPNFPMFFNNFILSKFCRK